MSIWKRIKGWLGPSKNERLEDLLFAKIFDPRSELDALVEKLKPTIAVKRWFETFVYNHAEELAAGNYVPLDYPDTWGERELNLLEECILWQSDFHHWSAHSENKYPTVSYSDPTEPHLFGLPRLTYLNDNLGQEWRLPELNKMMQDLVRDWKVAAQERALRFIAYAGDRLKADESVPFVIPDVVEHDSRYAEEYIQRRTKRQIQDMGLYFDDEDRVTTRPPRVLPKWERELKAIKKKRNE